MSSSQHIIDPALSNHPPDAVLFPETSEYVVAMRRLCAEAPLRDVPDDIFLHLYAYELAERLRDRQQHAPNESSGLTVYPFWPESLFRAARIQVHSAREIERLYPIAPITYWVRPARQEIEEQAQRVLGAIRFDPEDYCTSLEEIATDRGWIEHA